MKTARLISIVLLLLLSVSPVGAAQLSSTYGASIASSSSFYEWDNSESSMMTAGAVSDTMSYPVFVKNIPNAGQEISLFYSSSWSNFYPYTFVAGFNTASGYPPVGHSWEGIEYTFYIDTNSNGQQDAGEPSDSFTIPSGTIKELGFPTNVAVSAGNNPTITWKGIAQYQNLKYKILLFSVDENLNPRTIDPLFISDFVNPTGSDSYSFTYSGNLFDQNQVLSIAVEATEYAGNRIRNRSRYFVNHYSNSNGSGSPEFNASYPSSINSLSEYFSDGQTENYIMTASSVISDPGYEVLLKNMPDASADLDLTYYSGWSDFYPYLFVAGFSSANGYPDPGSSYEGINYTFYIDSNRNGTFDSGDPTDSFSLASGAIQKLGEVRNVNITSGIHPTITWKPIVTSADLIYRVMLFPGDSQGKLNRTDLLFISDPVSCDSTNTFSYTYTGSLFNEYSVLYAAIDAVETNSRRLINRSRYYQAPIPNSPSSLTVKAKSPAQIALGWRDNSANEAGFEIEQKSEGCSSANAWKTIETKDANSKTHIISGLTPGMTYSFRVKAFNDFGDSGYSDCASTATATTGTPAAPTNLSAESMSSTEIKVTWKDASPNETGFMVLKKTGDGPWELLAKTDADVTSYNDTAAANNTSSTSYRYYMYSYNEAGVSPPTYPVIVPYQPTGLETAPLAASGKIKLSWTNNSSDENGFEVWRKSGTCSSAGEWQFVTRISADRTTWVNSGLTSGGTYSYQIRAYKRIGSMLSTYGYSYLSNCSSAVAP